MIYLQLVHLGINSNGKRNLRYGCTIYNLRCDGNKFYFFENLCQEIAAAAFQIIFAPSLYEISMSSSTSNNNNNNSSSSSNGVSHSLLTIVVDVSPMAWQERALLRAKQDKIRAEAGKERSAGPATLEEVLDAIQAYAVATTNVEHNIGLLVVGVSDNESAILYPRADALQVRLNGSAVVDMKEPTDPRQMQQDVITGVADLTQRAANMAALNNDTANRQASMAAAVSKALCLINRFLVAANTGIAALHNSEHYLNRVDDEGVVALMGKQHGRNKKDNNTSPSSSWSPRILIVQASADRSRDYNAFMNCAFAAAKLHVVIDGCYLTSGTGPTSSVFLEQAVDLTGGVFLAPSGAAQVGGALTEVLLSVFLAPLACRSMLHLPALHKVDFRARCFETGITVDKALVCNQCLSIFSNLPSGPQCPTCQATIVRE